MASLLEHIYEWVQYITEWLGYPGIFFLMLIENIIPPLPSELVMPLAGSLVAEGRLAMPGVLLAGTLGSVAGAVLLYGLGLWLGRPQLERWVCRYGKYVFFDAGDFRRSLELFERHGKLTIFLARLVPGVRSLISIPAGVNRMPFAGFMLLTLLGTLAWNTLLAGAGMLLGRNWSRVLELVDAYELVLFAGLGAGVLFFLLRKFQQRGLPALRGDCEDLEAE